MYFDVERFLQIYIFDKIGIIDIKDDYLKSIINLTRL